ncbi:MAG: Rieske (2Fe-2S) protein [Candidatus Kapabacteria bacterium]|jgi:Rieske Fe-S protein|nr:Rieske (2Fe-2S) protein [Candidatus Kapabacteria bacterium]
MNTEALSPVPVQEGQTAPRREFLVQAASMLGLAVSAGTVVTLVNACETTTIKSPTSTGGTSTGGTSTGGTSTGGTSTGGTSTTPSNVISIAQEPSLQRAGGAIIKSIGSVQVLVMRTSTTDFLVLSAVCTHAACTVDLPMDGAINCQCHGSRFSASDGRVLNGPAGAPLRRYNATFDSMQNVLTIMV